MIRLKHNNYPVWINWEGDDTSFEKVKELILDDLAEQGFEGYTAYTTFGEPEIEKGSKEAWDKRIEGKKESKAAAASTNKSKGKKTLGDSTTSDNSFVG